MRRHVVGYEVVYGGMGNCWALRVDLNDGTSGYWPLYGGLEIKNAQSVPFGLSDWEILLLTGQLIPPSADTNGRWWHRTFDPYGDLEEDRLLADEENRELVRKVDAARGAAEAALFIEHARMEGL